MPRMKSYDEKDFMRDPTGPVPGSADRLLVKLFYAKFEQYYDAIRHIFNTGQLLVVIAWQHCSEEDGQRSS